MYLEENLRTNKKKTVIELCFPPPDHVKPMGQIPVIADLPVGNNLQDHCVTFLPFVLDTKPMNEKLSNPRNIKEYINSRTGTVTTLIPTGLKVNMYV
ncbi:hypothetical protein AVEN_13794-1 [Araneus ventricosus]|uniref:Uncharacterized protein n=1 Tax=Araneus ventricosus TaxID=182803 RepID=A0A4Y2VPD3_ARAVE|nr:hypothetical protein AVEN_13794-1 [Araneus ventricosus]